MTGRKLKSRAPWQSGWFWGVALIVCCGVVGLVIAQGTTIQLNSPVSFPVDI